MLTTRYLFIFKDTNSFNMKYGKKYSVKIVTKRQQGQLYKYQTKQALSQILLGETKKDYIL